MQLTSNASKAELPHLVASAQASSTSVRLPGNVSGSQAIRPQYYSYPTYLVTKNFEVIIRATGTSVDSPSRNLSLHPKDIDPQ